MLLKLACIVTDDPANAELVLKTGAETVVTAGVTLSAAGALVLAKKLESPGKEAVRLLFPAGIVLVSNSAMPSDPIVELPNLALPFKNVTVPVAAPFGLLADELLP